MAKICRLPKDLRNTIINIGDESDTHSQVPSHHVQQKRLLELKAPNWIEWAFTDGSCITKEKMDFSLLELGLPPSIQQNHHSKSWRDKHQQNHKQSRACRHCCTLINEYNHILRQTVLVHYGE